MEFEHKSVLYKETLDALVTKLDGIYVDCTLGGAGHASGVVQRLNEKALFIGFDQDPAALAAGKERLQQASCRIELVHSNFQHFNRVLDALGIDKVDGVVFDLGVSSHQLDIAERGFSYMQDGPLDMRMNPTQKLSAYQVVNEYSVEKLAEIIFSYGEERWAKRIARSIAQAREAGPIKTTAELTEAIKKAIPAAARREGPHPAKRTFQAIRIEVNNELGILRDTFTAVVERLNEKGRICIITFHSLEDRIAKKTLVELAKGCVCPKDFPVCVCNHAPQVKILGKPVAPSPAELEENPRSRSARLRVAEKL
ncbi:MAG: Ribosomal small subunit methyltransferase [Firmicutes bacterium]|nr:Ribosomal small subunit methyltransferase [Bacillota bacterium]